MKKAACKVEEKAVLSRRNFTYLMGSVFLLPLSISRQARSLSGPPNRSILGLLPTPMPPVEPNVNAAQIRIENSPLRNDDEPKILRSRDLRRRRVALVGHLCSGSHERILDLKEWCTHERIKYVSFNDLEHEASQYSTLQKAQLESGLEAFLKIEETDSALFSFRRLLPENAKVLLPKLRAAGFEIIFHRASNTTASAARYAVIRSLGLPITAPRASLPEVSASTRVAVSEEAVFGFAGNLLRHSECQEVAARQGPIGRDLPESDRVGSWSEVLHKTDALSLIANHADFFSWLRKHGIA